MKRLGIAFVVWLAAAAAGADETPAPVKSSRILIAEVVAIDPVAHKLTYKTTSGEEKTAALDAHVEERVLALKPGDTVTLTLREQAGDQTAVGIKKTTARKASNRK